MNEFLMALFLSYIMNGLIRIAFDKKIKKFFSLVVAFTLLICYFFKDFRVIDYSFILFILWYIILDIVLENIIDIIIKKQKKED